MISIKDSPFQWPPSVSSGNFISAPCSAMSCVQQQQQITTPMPMRDFCHSSAMPRVRHYRNRLLSAAHQPDLHQLPCQRKGLVTVNRYENITKTADDDDKENIARQMPSPLSFKLASASLEGNKMAPVATFGVSKKHHVRVRHERQNFDVTSKAPDCQFEPMSKKRRLSPAPQQASLLLPVITDIPIMTTATNRKSHDVTLSRCDVSVVYSTATAAERQQATVRSLWPREEVSTSRLSTAHDVTATSDDDKADMTSSMARVLHSTLRYPLHSTLIDAAAVEEKTDVSASAAAPLAAVYQYRHRQNDVINLLRPSSSHRDNLVTARDRKRRNCCHPDKVAYQECTRHLVGCQPTANHCLSEAHTAFDVHADYVLLQQQRVMRQRPSSNIDRLVTPFATVGSRRQLMMYSDGHTLRTCCHVPPAAPAHSLASPSTRPNYDVTATCKAQRRHDCVTWRCKDDCALIQHQRDGHSRRQHRQNKEDSAGSSSFISVTALSDPAAAVTNDAGLSAAVMPENSTLLHGVDPLYWTHRRRSQCTVRQRKQQNYIRTMTSYRDRPLAIRKETNDAKRQHVLLQCLPICRSRRRHQSIAMGSKSRAPGSRDRMTSSTIAKPIHLLM